MRAPSSATLVTSTRSCWQRESPGRERRVWMTALERLLLVPWMEVCRGTYSGPLSPSLVLISISARFSFFSFLCSSLPIPLICFSLLAHTAILTVFLHSLRMQLKVGAFQGKTDHESFQGAVAVTNESAPVKHRKLMKSTPAGDSLSVQMCDRSKGGVDDSTRMSKDVPEFAVFPLSGVAEKRKKNDLELELSAQVSVRRLQPRAVGATRVEPGTQRGVEQFISQDVLRSFPAPPDVLLLYCTLVRWSLARRT